MHSAALTPLRRWSAFSLDRPRTVQLSVKDGDGGFELEARDPGLKWHGRFVQHTGPLLRLVAAYLEHFETARAEQRAQLGKSDYLWRKYDVGDRCLAQQRIERHAQR